MLFNFLMKKKVAIIDYGLGNIVSAQQSFIKDAKENNLNVDVVITNKVKIINDSTHIVFKGINHSINRS